MDAATFVLETPRLRLRTVALSDAAFLLALLNDPAWIENIGDRGVRSLADAEAYIKERIWAPYEAQGYGMYAAQLRSTRLPIGLCGLVKREFLSSPDLGVALLPGYTGQGYASEAARAVISHAKGSLGIGPLYAIVKRTNQRSVRMLERLGFHHQAPHLIAPGDEVELYVAV